LPGLTRQSILFLRKMDHRVSALRAGPVMTADHVLNPAHQQQNQQNDDH
jgi:hypothetical protein